MIFDASFKPTFTSALDYKKLNEEKQKAAEEQKKLEEAEKKQQETEKKRQMQNEMEMMKQQLENSNEQAEATAKEFEDFGKCLTIASRITRGDIVPMKDMKFLMEKQPDLYKQAILMRQPNSDPKKHKSLIDDEEDEQSSESTESMSGSDSADIAESVSEPAAAEVSADTSSE